MKLSILQRTLHLQSRAAASRARREICDRARPLADTPYNRAQVLASLIAKGGAILRDHGFDGLVTTLTDDRA